MVYWWTFCFSLTRCGLSFHIWKVNKPFLQNNKPQTSIAVNKTFWGAPTGRCACNFNYNFDSNRTFLVLTSGPVILGSPVHVPQEEQCPASHNIESEISVAGKQFTKDRNWLGHCRLILPQGNFTFLYSFNVAYEQIN